MMINDNKRTMLLTIIVVALVISSPVLVKWMLNQDSQISSETYYNLRIIEQIRTNEGSDARHIDALQNREYNFNIFYFMFSKTTGNMEAVAKLLPVLLGIISMVLFYILLRNLNFGQDDIFFAMIILMTTPVFLYDFTTFSQDIIALPIILLGLILFARGNIFSALFFGATAFIDVFYTVVSLIIVGGSYIYHKNKHLFHSTNLAVMILSLIIGVIALKINYFLSFIPILTGLNGFIIEFGAVKGYALITIGLALIGLFSWWNKEKQKAIILISSILLVCASLFFQNLRLPVGLIMAAFAGFSISYLSNREWEIYMLKGVTLLLVFCILFFSAILSLNYQTKNISDEEVNAISYLASANENDIILSAERNGFIIEYVAGRSAYLDENSYKFDDYKDRKITADKIYYATNMQELEVILNQEKITHILIDSEMESGEIWNGRAEGLLFFLENSNNFIKIFYNDNIQIYRYVGRESR